MSTAQSIKQRIVLLLSAVLVMGGFTLLLLGPLPARALEIPPYCTVEFLETIWGAEAENAASICSAESGSDPFALNDDCFDARSADYSVGLFQINLLNRCPLGINWSGDHDNPQCWVVDDAALEDCKLTYGWGDPDLNSIRAKEIFDNTETAGLSPWCPWGTAPLFGLCSGKGTDIRIDAPPGSTPHIEGLKLQLHWPPIPIPGGNVRLNDIVEGDRTICLGELIRFSYALFLWISGMLSFVVLVYVGILYQLSSGRPALRARAANNAKKIFIGIAILFFAVVILNFIDPGLTNVGLCGPNAGIEELSLQGIDIGGEVELLPDPRILPVGPIDITLTANAIPDLLIIEPGDLVTLAWTSTGATLCWGETNYPASSARDLWDDKEQAPTEGGAVPLLDLTAPEGTYRFSLTCFQGTTSTITAQVNVRISSTTCTPGAPTINEWVLVTENGERLTNATYISPQLDLDSCRNANFEWSSTGDSCTFSGTGPLLGGAQDPSGSVALWLPVSGPWPDDYAYTVTCTSSALCEAAEKTVTITMTEESFSCKAP